MRERCPSVRPKQFGRGATVLAGCDIGRQGNGSGAGRLPQQAAPFGEQAIDITPARKFLGLDDLAGGFVGGDDGGDDFARTKAVAGWEALVQVAFDGGAPVGAFAEGGEAAEAPGVGAGEAVGGEEVGAIEQERIEWVATVF